MRFMTTTGDGPLSRRAHYVRICAEYLDAVKRPGESLGLTVEMVSPEVRGRVSERDIERAGLGWRVGVRIGDVGVTEITGDGAPDEVILGMLAFVLDKARVQAALGDGVRARRFGRHG
jgi:hypothetical protein